MTALARVIEILAGNRDYQLPIARDRISPATRFREDLGFDSIAMMSLVYELQEHYPSLDEMAIAGWQTVGDCVRELEALGT